MFFICSFIVIPLAVALDYDDGARKFSTPLREHSVIITKHGYFPNRISIFAGEKIKFFLTTTTSDTSCLMIPEKELFMSAKNGNVSEGEAFFPNPGEYTYYCPTGKIKGKITVLKRKLSEEEEFEKKRSRSLASERIKVWRPREY